MNMDSGPSKFKAQLADLADDRRSNLTHVERVSTTFPEGHTLGSMANAMAIAMLYAQFEGFVKDALRLYVEYVEGQKVPQSEAIPCLIAYSWRPSFNKMRAKGSLDHQIQFAEERIATLAKPLEFGKHEREIDTRSNLRFDVLDGLARTLGLDRSSLSSQKKKLNALVDKRNCIAHGNRAAKVSEIEMTEALSCVQVLLKVVEDTLCEAVDHRAYRRTPHDQGSRHPAL